jgi:hypothetical protein
MSTEFFVITVIIAAFGAFAGTLYWADVQTRRLGQ